MASEYFALKRVVAVVVEATFAADIVPVVAAVALVQVVVPVVEISPTVSVAAQLFPAGREKPAVVGQH